MAQHVALVVHDNPVSPHVVADPASIEVHFWVGTPLDHVLAALRDQLDAQARAAVERLWSSDEAPRQVVQISPGSIRVTESPPTS